MPTTPRRAYDDPISGAPDWALIRAPDNGIMSAAGSGVAGAAGDSTFDAADDYDAALKRLAYRRHQECLCVIDRSTAAG